MKSIFYSAMIAIFMIACSGNNSSEQSEVVSDTSQKGYTAIISNYIEVKNALVSTDASSAKIASLKLRESMVNSDMNASFISMTNEMSSTDDIEDQRIAFKKLTDALIPELEKANLENPVFVQYCPMAFDNTGASLLAIEKEINNPYFGDKMLRCGKVQREL